MLPTPPTWVIYTLAATGGLLVLIVLVGCWLIWRDRRRLSREAERLGDINRSLSDTGGKLARLSHSCDPP